MEDEMNEDEDQMSTEELAENTDAVLNVLIELLIKKKVISEEEFDKALKEE